MQGINSFTHDAVNKQNLHVQRSNPIRRVPQPAGRGTTSDPLTMWASGHLAHRRHGPHTAHSGMPAGASVAWHLPPTPRHFELEPRKATCHRDSKRRTAGWGSSIDRLEYTMKTSNTHLFYEVLEVDLTIKNTHIYQ